MRALVLLMVLVAAGCGAGTVDSPDETQARTLTVRQELPAGPIWTEGSTMIVRIYNGNDMVEELRAGDDYKPAVAVASLVPGTYRVEAAQAPCTESCRTPTRDPETAQCEASVTIEDRSVDLVAEVTDASGCQLGP